MSDDVLSLLGTDWTQFKILFSEWVETNPHHQSIEDAKQFAAEFDRYDTDVKELRNVFMVIVGSNKPWEVAVGQAIAAMSVKSSRGMGTLAHMLTPKTVAHLCGIKPRFGFIHRS